MKAIDFRSFSLAKKLSLVQGGIVIVIMGIFTMFTTQLISSRIEKKVSHDLLMETQIIVNLISSYHNALADNADNLANVFASYFPGAFSVDPSEMTRMGGKQVPVLKNGNTPLNLNFTAVDSFTRTTKSVGTVFVRVGDDFVRITTSVKKEDGTRAVGTLLDRKHPAYQGLLRGKDYIGKATLFGKDYMTKYFPINDKSGRTIGALFIGIDFTDGLKALKEIIKGIKIGDTGYVYAIDAREGADLGTVRIHPYLEGKNALDMKDASGRPIIRQMLEQKDGFITYPWVNKELKEYRPQNKLVCFHLLKEWGWLVCVGGYLHELNAETTYLKYLLICATVVVVVIMTLLFGILVRRWVTKPLQEAVELSGNLARGDFSCVDVIKAEKAASSDEVGIVIHSIGKMATTLNGVLEGIVTSAGEVSEAASRLLSNSQRMATGINTAAGEAGSIATASEEMSATSGDIAEKCTMVAEGAKQANDLAQTGATVVQETIHAMEQVADLFKSSAKTVEALGSRSDQIGEIVGAIEDIADQTNLLALNAAIEAARAGDQGRGFAVVADEVRALAERTTKATKEIAQMIQSIQNETKRAVSSMDGGVKEVENGARSATGSGQALGHIVAQIQLVSGQVDQIATAAQQQTATTSEISSTILGISGIFHETSGGAQEAATSASQLADLADNLKKLVGQFNLRRTGYETAPEPPEWLRASSIDPPRKLTASSQNGPGHGGRFSHSGEERRRMHSR